MTPIRVLATLASSLLMVASGTSGAQTSGDQRPVIVASKPFGESYLLAETFAQLLESRGLRVERRPGLGATEIAFEALRSNAIDVYPEYTGTGLLAILREPFDSTLRDPRRAFGHVARRFADLYRVRWLAPLGFQNGYAIAVRRDVADRHGLRTLSDLTRSAPNLVAGFTSDFIGRPDGLAGLTSAYGMRFKTVRPLAPTVKYVALAESAVDVIDGYSTDGLLSKYDLVTLIDDRAFFPPYEAAALVSPRLAQERTDAIATLDLLSGRLDEAAMRAWNRRVEVDGEPIPMVAADILRSLGLTSSGETTASSLSPTASTGFLAFMWERRAETMALTLRHLQLVLVALIAAVLVAVPLGLVLERAPAAAEWVVGGLGVLQTIPSIALLAFMIPLLGVGLLPALVALWLYALYPIARNTYTGVRSADPEAVEACEAMGATAVQRLLWVRLPLAAPIVVAGVRTAAVITVGAATLAAFIGAGGLGEPIVTGLALVDSRLILAGALPAALLALLVDGVLALIERAVRPAHMRLRKPATPAG
jgi:osmoprotectant transport system permease protein